MSQADSRISILLVEDHQVTMEGLRSWIDKTNSFHVVGSTSNAQSALQTARSIHPQVTLLDLHLQGNHSIERLIIDLVETGTKVVVFSAEERKYFIDLALKCGAVAFISKLDPYFTVSRVIIDVCSGVEGRYISPQLKDAYQQRFSQAEQEILVLLAKGMKYEDIAGFRMTTASTVRKQCEKLQFKLELQSREELIAWSVANGYHTAPRPQSGQDVEQ